MENKELCKNTDVYINNLKICMNKFIESFNEIGRTLNKITTFVSIEKCKLTRDELINLYDMVEYYNHEIIEDFKISFNDEDDYYSDSYRKELRLFRDVCNNAITLQEQLSEYKQK